MRYSEQGALVRKLRKRRAPHFGRERWVDVIGDGDIWIRCLHGGNVHNVANEDQRFRDFRGESSR